MKVILLQDVAGLGRRYEVHEVASGFARNYLLPKTLAQLATAANLKQMEQLKKRRAAEKQLADSLAVKDLAGLAGLELRLAAKANAAGHLFAGLHREDIAAALQTQQRLSFRPEHFKLTSPIKAVGEFMIPVKVGEQTSRFKLVVEPEPLLL